MATVEKIRKDIEKTKEKISAQQKRLRELEAQLTEEENLEIVRMVKAVRMDNKELTAFLKAYASGLIIQAANFLSIVRHYPCARHLPWQSSRQISAIPDRSPLSPDALFWIRY